MTKIVCVAPNQLRQETQKPDSAEEQSVEMALNPDRIRQEWLRQIRGDK